MAKHRLLGEPTDAMSDATPPGDDVQQPGVHPGWPPGFWEKLERLGPASEEFEDAVRAWVPSPTWRDRVIDEYVEWANSPEAAVTPNLTAGARSEDRSAPGPDGSPG